MKKIYLALLMAILLVLPLVSALEFDNVKQYDEETKTVTIRDSLIFIPTTKVAEIELLSPIHHTLFDDNYAFELKINLYEDDYTDFIKEIETYDYFNLKDTKTGTFNYKVYNPIGEEEVTNIDTSCSTSKENITTCIDKEVIVTKIGTWEDINLKTIIKGERTIRAYWSEELEAGERIEWIPTFAGVRVEEWADFGTATIREFWHTYQDANEMNSIGMGMNWTAQSDYTPVGIYAYFDGASTHAIGTVNATLFTGGVGGSGQTGTVNCVNNTFVVTVAGKLNISMPDCSLVTNQTEVGMTFEHNTNGNNAMWMEIDRDGGACFAPNKLWYHDYGTAYAELTGRCMPFEVWENDYVPVPTVAVTAPTNTTYTSQVTDLEYTVDAVGDADCWYSLNEGANSTAVSAGTNFTGLEADVGDNQWIVYCNSSTNNIGLDSVYFNLNLIAPNISMTYPQNTTYTIKPTEINYTYSANTEWCWSSVDGGATNSSPAICDGNFNTAAASEGDNTFMVGGNTSVGGTNQSYITFFVDTIDPIIDIEYPTTNIVDSYIYSTDIVMALNWSVKDTNLANCWYYNNTANVTVTCGANATFTLPYGTYTHIVYANDTLLNSADDSETITYSYAALQNKVSWNGTTTETKGESFLINISSGGTVVDGYLWYNGTKYTPTEKVGGSSYEYTYAFGSIPELTSTATVENRSYHWEFVVDSVSYNSSALYQYVNFLNVTSCNGTNRFINVTFADEKTLAKINATMTNDWQYYLGDGVLYKTNSYSDVTYDEPEHNFCFVPITENVSVSGTSTHYNAIYPQRKYNYAGSYNSTTTDITVYLLGSSDGIYTTFQVLSSAEQPISGVTATVQTIVGGSLLQTDAGITGDDGGVTFWVNPDKSHTFTFSKDGYADLVTSLTPAQSQYTVYLGGVSTAGSSAISYLKGITYDVAPKPGPLVPYTNYTFEFNLSSSFWTLDSWGYVLKGDGVSLTSNSSTVGSGGSLSSYQDTLNYTTIALEYYWVINGTYVNSTSFLWKPIDITDKGYGLKTFINRWSDFMDGGMFGATAFTKYLLVFLLMFGLVGMLSYSLGVTEPGYLLIIIGSIVILFDGVLGLLPGNGSLSAISVFMIAIIIWRQTR